MLRSKAILVMMASVIITAFTLILPSDSYADDPGLPDSMIVGNFNGSPILAGLNTQLVVPVYLKTDDSVTFAHVPIATDNDYIASRDSGNFLPPLSLWDEKLFLQPDQNSPTIGYTNQGFLGFAYLFDPRDPQNFLYTNYQWVHIANFRMTTGNNIEMLGDTTYFAAGHNPQNGGLVLGLEDGITEVIPQIVWGSIYFPPNTQPVFSEPQAGTFDVNEQFGICLDVSATDADDDNLVLTVDFGPTNYEWVEIQNIPGSISYSFCWVPDEGSAGTYPLSFIVNDGNGGVITVELTLNVTPAGLVVGNINTLPGTQISVPVLLNNEGGSSAVGGFEILISWSPEALTLNGVTRSGRTGSFEFFRLNNNDGGQGTARITGVADMRNGQISPPLQPGTGPIFFLEFSVSDDEDLIGVNLPVVFLNLDETDNTLSDSTGYLLVHPMLTNGLVSVIGPDDVITGDINLNGVPYEIGDVVLYVNHLTNRNAFPFDPVQVEASDVNADGIPESVADLVYLVNIVAGNIEHPKLEPIDGNIVVSMSDINNGMQFEAISEFNLGAVLIAISHAPGLELTPISTGPFTLAYYDDGNILTVLAYFPESGHADAGRINIFNLEGFSGELAVTEASASDAIGHLLNVVSHLEAPIPTAFELHQNYPNPFNATTLISFGLPQSTDVRLDVFNITGQKIDVIVNSHMDAGRYDIIWDGNGENGRPVSTGVYFYRLTAGDITLIEKMMLLK